MNFSKARNIGRIQTLKGGLIGCTIAYLLFSLFAGPGWILEVGGDFRLGLLVGIASLLGWIYIIGGEIGYQIIIRGRTSALGIVAAFIITWLTVAVTGFVVGFDEPFRFKDYVWALIVTFTVWGGIPMLLLGILVGYLIKSRSESI